MKTIPLTQGKIALVDDEDYERVSAFKWYAHKNYRTFYALRHTPWKDGARQVIRMHSFIMGIPYVDHVNCDGLDNRKKNLRSADSRQSSQNRRKELNSCSRFKGVSWDKKHWRARIKGTISLGNFDSEEAAARAYDEAAKKLFGEFARLNFP